MLGVLAGSIISGVRRLECVAARHHEKGADEATVQPSLGSNYGIECSMSVFQFGGYT